MTKFCDCCNDAGEPYDDPPEEDFPDDTDWRDYAHPDDIAEYEAIRAASFITPILLNEEPPF